MLVSKVKSNNSQAHGNDAAQDDDSPKHALAAGLVLVHALGIHGPHEVNFTLDFFGGFHWSGLLVMQKWMAAMHSAANARHDRMMAAMIMVLFSVEISAA